jgi:SAM-dependent methyltransferase
MKKISNIDLKHYKLIRKSVNNAINNFSEQFNFKRKKILEIAPQIHKDSEGLFCKSKIYTLDIDENSNADFIADICKNNNKKIKSNFFDFVLCTEVLEHTLNPFKAVKEIHRILKPKGIVLISTPFDFRIHGPLPDCWRFTEHGLKSLLRDFEIISLKPIENKKRFLMPIHYVTIAKKK